MIEVNFIDIFANGGTPTDILKKKMTPTVCISSAKPNAALKVEVVYSISSSNTDYDQILCSETVENIPAGMVEFDLETEIPDLSKIPREQLLGLASILFLFYTEDGHQFVRVGYFVKIDYPGVQLIETPREYQEDAFELEEIEYSSEGAQAEEAEQMVEKEAMQPIGTEENAEKEEDSQEQENPEDDVSIGAEEAEEANKEEIKPEGVHDGILFITEENFKAMDIDMSKIEGQILDPPLVTVFTEAWTAAEEEENSRQPEEE
ncbi:histone chaperone ASF1 [Nematocida ausubeli]|nr:histone chaperone ASF1 [Nematocida ausubeli]KAI5134789.1 histone chaperone ASF1 [Nematocida ausubeli]